MTCTNLIERLNFLRKKRDSDKKILFWLSPLLFFYYINVSYYLPHVMIKRILFFISFLRSLRHDQKKKKIIWLLHSLRHNLRVKKYFFHLVTTFNTPWSREKPFFHFGTTFNTTWSQKKKFDFYWITTLTTLPPWKNVIFSFHWDVHYGNIFLHDPASTYYAHYVTNLSKIPKRYTPRKKTCAT